MTIKERPAIIISTSMHNLKNKDVICCAITSNPKNYEGSVEISNLDLEKGILKTNCRVKPNKIFTLEQNKILKKIGKLNKEKSKTVIEELNKLIEIKDF